MPESTLPFPRFSIQFVFRVYFIQLYLFLRFMCCHVFPLSDGNSFLSLSSARMRTEGGERGGKN